MQAGDAPDCQHKRASGHDFSHPAQVNPVLKQLAGKFYLLDLILKARTEGGFER